MKTEFQKGFEACQLAAVKICRTEVLRPAGYNGMFEGLGAMRGIKTGLECAKEVAGLVAPRWRAKE